MTRPDAIVCANDEIAMGVLEAARAARITVPHDLAVTGWDDIPAARHLAPPLTTVRQPMLDLGRRAAELLRDRITTHRSRAVARAPANRAGRSLELRMQRPYEGGAGMTRQAIHGSRAGGDRGHVRARGLRPRRRWRRRRRRQPGGAASQAPEVDTGAASGEIDVWAMGTEGENLGVLADASWPRTRTSPSTSPPSRGMRPTTGSSTPSPAARSRT